jgi:hypothetical protein
VLVVFHSVSPFLVAESAPSGIGCASALVCAILYFSSVRGSDDQSGFSVGLVGDGSGATAKIFVVGLHS